MIKNIDLQTNKICIKQLKQVLVQDIIDFYLPLYGQKSCLVLPKETQRQEKCLQKLVDLIARKIARLNG